MESVEDRVTGGVDPGQIRRVLETYPVRLGVLFGSHVRGTNGTHSDVDVAIEFDEEMPDEDRRRVRLDLIVDLSQALDTDDVDVTELDGIDPEVGASALAHGIVLVGTRERADRFRRAFERLKPKRTRTERMERFDDILDRLEGRV